MLQSRILRDNGCFALDVDGIRLPLYAYMSYQPQKADYNGFREAGVRLFSVPVYAGDKGISATGGIRPFRPGFWHGPDDFDFSAADEDFRRIMGSPEGEGFLLVRLVLNMPDWWESAHPEAMARDFAGQPIWLSFCSAVYLESARKCMEQFERWLHDSGWSARVALWQVAGGSTEEFLYPLRRPLQYADYSKCAREAYSRWLSLRYGTVDALNRVWGKHCVSFASAAPPSPAQRRYASLDTLRGRRERPVVDWYLFHSEATADFIAALCGEARRITGGRLPIGAFYGYIGSVTDPDLGHHALNRLLDCPDVSFFASPFTYHDCRAPGADLGFQGPVDSAALHGKPWFMEADIRTSLSRGLRDSMPSAAPKDNDLYESPVWFGPESTELSLGSMKRAFAKAVCCGTALWWFDMWGGWYKLPEYMDFQRRAREVYARAVEEQALTPRAELAVFADERLSAYCRPDGPLFDTTVGEQLRRLGQSGVPFRLFSFFDLAKVPPEEYRMAMLWMPPSVSMAEQELLSHWNGGGRTVVFTGVPGLYGGGPGSLTGFACDIQPETEPVQARGPHGVWPEQPLILPRIRLHSGENDVTLAFGTDGSPCCLLRRSKSFQTVWSTAPALPASLCRELAALSGVHVWSMDGDAVWANDSFVGIHAAADGVHRLYLPYRPYGTELTEVFTGETRPWAAFHDFRMKMGETLLFRIR